MRFWGRRRKQRRVLVLGLDCASPDLIFRQFKNDLPTLRQLMQGGTWGDLSSSIPCITIPAWSSMLSGRDPGELGVYGFRNRPDFTYASMQIADSRNIDVQRVWDYMGENGLDSLVASVPQTFPVKALRGHLVSGFLTPGISSGFTYPAILKSELTTHFSDLAFDITNFRTSDKSQLLQRIFDFTDTQYRLLTYLLKEKRWDFAIHVNMGVDRIHHGFWRYHDPEHRLHEPNNAFKDAIHDYYKFVDEWIGRILEQVGDGVIILIVSDHGVKRMDGAICINEWLWHHGWLHFCEEPIAGQVTSFDKMQVDWSRTRAWSTGGYYGRIFLNVAGREPQGIIPASDYQYVRSELAEMLKQIPDAEGKSLRTRVIKPEEVYRSVNGIPPDLIVYFGDLHWRTVGGVGYGQFHILENDTGSDDANHAEEGMFILYDPYQKGLGEVYHHQLMDITPTILAKMGMSVPSTMQGQVI